MIAEALAIELTKNLVDKEEIYDFGCLGQGMFVKTRDYKDNSKEFRFNCVEIEHARIMLEAKSVPTN